MAHKAAISFGMCLGLHREKACLEQAGKKEEAEAKRDEAEAMKAKAIRKAEYAQEALNSIRIDRGQKSPEHRSGLQLIYDEGFRVLPP